MRTLACSFSHRGAAPARAAWAERLLAPTGTPRGTPTQASTAPRPRPPVSCGELPLTKRSIDQPGSSCGAWPNSSIISGTNETPGEPNGSQHPPSSGRALQARGHRFEACCAHQVRGLKRCNRRLATSLYTAAADPSSPPRPCDVADLPTRDGAAAVVECGDLALLLVDHAEGRPKRRGFLKKGKKILNFWKKISGHPCKYT